MIAIIDYDAGNIRSVEKAFVSLGQEVTVTRDAEVLRSADKVVLPGVGNFGDCMQNLEKFGLVPVIREIASSGKPFLGICVGLQLLFEESEESPGVKGLGILKGRILRIPEGENRKIPHMGWNSIHLIGQNGTGRLFSGIPEQSYVYFVHSYYLKAADESIVTATTEYGVTIHASVEKGNVFATQFHPEKSSDTGLAILRNFAGLS
ncbi:imidazole glycerol phosphate synthase subunit HisH [Bilifractor sp. HCP3S3_D3]|uniref:imidazole glycerol phosphate synthase subunit HisH n=1 Tax=Bilifractor sp. HCP3S3_D3 TaxID=3438907 RepID=UPI002A86A35C|nr:imidazole glycerol phosphate synthase subunit HisH [Eubacterium sp.]MDY5114327.1 imidazole glycerol phosphate synthase subunit HisH [Bilifractor sp.]